MDKEIFLNELPEQIQLILGDYYYGGVSIAQTLDNLEELGMEPKARRNVEAQILGNDSFSDDMIDYIKDRIDLDGIRLGNEIYSQDLLARNY